MSNKFPIYIPSKGRYDSMLTAKALDRMGIDYKIIIEDQEYDKYLKVSQKDKLLILDKTYQDNYDVFDDLDSTKSKGPGAARNFAWDHSIENGFDWHWVMDDNIRSFKRLNKNKRIIVESDTFFQIMEDFILRYENIGMAGPSYSMFTPDNIKQPPFILNTRIYSCNFIRNDLPYRWRGRYNEDTDLSLRMIKDGWCTIQFNPLLQDKITTQAIAGGNTKEFYAKEGTLPKSKMLAEMHPDVTKVVWKFGRWHHQINYRQFGHIKPIKKKNIEIKKGINNYGMALKVLT